MYNKVLSQCVCAVFLLRICSLLHASWWEVTWQTVPCDLSGDGQSRARPLWSSANTIWRGKGNLNSHTLAHNKDGSCRSHTITAREQFKWKIALPNQSLVESLSLGHDQSKAHNAFSPWNNGWSVADSACHHVDPDEMPSFFFFLYPHIYDIG